MLAALEHGGEPCWNSRCELLADTCVGAWHMGQRVAWVFLGPERRHRGSPTGDHLQWLQAMKDTRWSLMICRNG